MILEGIGVLDMILEGYGYSISRKIWRGTVTRLMADFPNDLALLNDLEEFRVPSGPLVNPADAITHPYFVARASLRAGKDRILDQLMLPGLPLRFSDQTEYPAHAAPLLGEHHQVVLRDLLGYAQERIEYAARSQGNYVQANTNAAPGKRR